MSEEAKGEESQDTSHEESTSDRATRRQAVKDQHEGEYDNPASGPLGGITNNQEQAERGDLYDKEWSKERDSEPE